MLALRLSLCLPMLRTCCHATTLRVTCPEQILGFLRMTADATPPSWQIALDRGPHLPPTHPNRAMGLVLDTPTCPLHGVPSDSLELLRAIRHLSWEPHFDMTSAPHPTQNQCPKTMARLAIADAGFSHATLQRARLLDCRALDALDGLAPHQHFPETWVGVHTNTSNKN